MPGLARVRGDFGDHDDVAGRDGGPEGEQRRRRTIRPAMPLWQELPLLLVVAFCLAVLIRTFLLQAFYIPSGSMEYTLNVRDRVLVNKMVYDIREPAHGEVVVFRGPDNWAPESALPQPQRGFLSRLGRTVGDLVGVSEPNEKDFIKRVIGLPGDVVSCCDVKGRVTVNGYPLDEPYVTDNSQLDLPATPNACGPRRFGPITVGAGQLWVMGDHRAISLDSRCQGTIPIENVIGRAFVILWPSGNWAGLPVPKTFEKVPRPFAAAPAHDGRPITPESGVPSGPRVGPAAWEPAAPSGGDGSAVPVVTRADTSEERWPRSIPHAMEVLVPLVWTLSHRRPTREPPIRQRRLDS